MFNKTNSSTPLEKARTRVPRDQVFSLLFVYCSLHLHKVIAFMTGLSTENCFGRFLLSAHFLVREIVSSNCLPRFIIFVCIGFSFNSAQIYSGVGFPHPVPPDLLKDLTKPTQEEAIQFLGRLMSSLTLVVTAIQR